MGDDPNTSVVDGYCRSYDMPNLFICNSSVIVTSGGNPTETKMAVTARAAH